MAELWSNRSVGAVGGRLFMAEEQTVGTMTPWRKFKSSHESGPAQERKP